MGANSIIQCNINGAIIIIIILYYIIVIIVILVIITIVVVVVVVLNQVNLKGFNPLIVHDHSLFFIRSQD